MIAGSTDRLRLLVYGIERRGIQTPDADIQTPRGELIFAPFETPVRFQDFDGVIFFQGIFEKFDTRRSGYDGASLSHQWYPNELDKRTKEVEALLRRGGLVCALICNPFIDMDTDEGRDFRGTDLAKRLLNDAGIPGMVSD